MATTIVEYSDSRPPENRFPDRIVSPSRSVPFRFSATEPIGDPHQEAPWVSQYMRCRTYGSAGRLIERQVPNEARLAVLRQTLAVPFQRNLPAY